MPEVESTEASSHVSRGRMPQLEPGSTALALRFFDKGDYEEAVSELARCEPTDDPATQLRIAERIRSTATTALEFGELLVRLELTDAQSPAAKLGQELLARVAAIMQRLHQVAELDEVDPLLPVPDPNAPPEPGATPDEVEDFLAAHASASPAFLRAPFGVTPERLPLLVERDLRGYDVWWDTCFFAVRRGRSPRQARQLIWVQRRLAALLTRRAKAWLRAHSPKVLRAQLKRWRGLPSAASGGARPPGVGAVRAPFLGVLTARTGLELHALIALQAQKKQD